MAEEENNDDAIDRLSNLPNPLLCHILSFLPTKTTVQTTPLISRHFRNLWKTLQTFDFNGQSEDKHTERFMFFSIFVNTVLALRESRCIRKFRLSCCHVRKDVFYTSSIDTWVRTATGPLLEEFHLTLQNLRDFDNLFNLPLALLSCSNLVFLRLCGSISLQLKDSSVVCLPSLKVLQLIVADGSDANSVNILLAGCPILENLELSFCHYSFARLRVQSSLLKRLEITFENEAGGCVEIDTPGLKYLSLTKIKFSSASAFGNLCNVKEAHLAEFPILEVQSVYPLFSLFRALSGIKHLTLDQYLIERLLDDPYLEFPEFCYLLHLDVGLPCFNMVFLFDMLQKCPMLQTFIILQCMDPEPVLYNSSKYGWVWKPKTVAKCLESPFSEWLVKPDTVPKCLASHLTFIHYKDFQGKRLELEFIRYVLQNGLLLKTMVISGIYLLQQPEEWVELISNLPRGSAMCQFQFQ